MNYFPAPHPFAHPYLYYNIPHLPSSSRQTQRLHFVWPRDGKPSRTGTWGRWKDLLSNRGPDIFVSRGPSRPQKASWTNRYHLWPDMLLANDCVEAMPWARRGGEKRFDFRRRRYRVDDRRTWTDAVWAREKNYPRAWRCGHGQWYQMSPDGVSGVPGLGGGWKLFSVCGESSGFVGLGE